MSQACRFLVLITYFVLSLCTFTARATAADKDFILPVKSNEIKIMSYNVQNLFNAEHDKGKNDFEFLPANDPEKKNCPVRKGTNYCLDTDWTAPKVDMKINQIVKVLEAQGDLPDVLVLMEVENRQVVGQLSQALGFSGFEMTNSPDARGIDVAVLYRSEKLKKLDYQEREVKNAMHLTRNLSVLVFEMSAAVGGGKLAIFPNHWPSQASPTKARLIVANSLRDFIDDIRKKYAKDDYYTLVTGDFNVTEKDNPQPVESVLMDSKWDYKMRDIRQMAKKAKSPMIPKMPKATYYYGVDDSWNEFDRFLVSANLADGSDLEADSRSYRIHAPTFLAKKNKSGEKIPFRYNHRTSDKRYAGYSDHFAITMKLQMQ